MKRPDRVPFFARFVELDAPTISTGLRAGINLPGVKRSEERRVGKECA
jgi:hypothetical protein